MYKFLRPLPAGFFFSIYLSFFHVGLERQWIFPSWARWAYEAADTVWGVLTEVPPAFLPLWIVRGSSRRSVRADVRGRNF